MKIRLLTNITAGKAGDTIDVTAPGARKLIELGAAEAITSKPQRRTRKTADDKVESGDETAIE